jgi:hypothetical protein
LLHMPIGSLGQLGIQYDGLAQMTASARFVVTATATNAADSPIIVRLITVTPFEHRALAGYVADFRRHGLLPRVAE